MSTRLPLLLVGSAFVLTGLAGCCCKRHCCPTSGPPAAVPAGPPIATAPVFPQAGPVTAPPAPAPVGQDIRSFGPAEVRQGSYYWQPADNGSVRLSPPVVDSEEPPRLPRDQVPRMPKVQEK